LPSWVQTSENIGELFGMGGWLFIVVANLLVMIMGNGSVGKGCSSIVTGSVLLFIADPDVFGVAI
jgi:hypothetical protein